MTGRFARLRLVALLALAAASFDLAHAGSVNAVQLWSRKRGAHSDDQNPGKVHPTSFEVETAKLIKRRIYDAQYGQTMTYVGVPLGAILARFERGAHDDLAILHFENGMRVPVPIDEATLGRLKAFLAVEVCDAHDGCSKDFPAIGKNDAFAAHADPRPITFSWNKLVVATAWHPSVPMRRAQLFSPWHHTDSLSGVEFVNAQAYYRQFELGEAAGQKVFAERCQFCHGARYVGARFGWDFVSPLALHEKRSPEHLLNHVKYPKAQALEMGLLMPPQRDVSLDEMEAMWRWMRAAARRTLPRYTP